MEKIDYKEIQCLYTEKGFTFKEIADQFKCSSGVIRKIAKRHNIIAIRGKSKHRKIIIQKCDMPLSINDTDFFKMSKIDFDDKSVEVMLGGLLGDSYLRVRTNKNSFSYNVHFANCEDQKGYVEWKRSFFGDKANDVRVEKRGSNSFENSQDLFVFSTKSCNLEYVYNLLYQGKEKIITEKYLSYLTPLSLAVWYMDDGSFNVQNRVVRMSTMCFSEKENNILKKYFYEKLRMPCFLEKVNCGTGFSLVLTQNSSKKFLRLIYPYRYEYFDYKFSILNNPSETLKADLSVSKETLQKV
jgi:hypothetical protein